MPDASTVPHMSTDTNPVTHLLHTGQPGEGMGYNPHKPLPSPLHVHENGTVDNVPWEGCRFAGWETGYAPNLLGFQNNPEVQQVDLYVEDWKAGDPDACVGMFPVLLDRGSIACLARPVVEVTAFADPVEVATEPEPTGAEMGEPIYYTSVAFTGVRFAKPGTELVEGEFEVEPGRVDPVIRDEGRAWLALTS